MFKISIENKQKQSNETVGVIQFKHEYPQMLINKVSSVKNMRKFEELPTDEIAIDTEQVD